MNDETDYACLINAASRLSTTVLDEEAEGSADRIDSETRDAARSLLRAEFKRMENGDDDQPDEAEEYDGG